LANFTIFATFFDYRLYMTSVTQQPAATVEKPFEGMTLGGHEQVTFCYDEATGLRAIIAVHNTVLGPSLGGLRMWKYANETEALNDVLRLSRGMTYKASITGLNLGGGKAVIIGDSKKDKSEALIRRFGRFVESLGGKYITAEDVGISTREMEYIRMETRHVSGLPESMGGSGDPSPVTAYGVYMGMKAAAKHKWGSDSLTGKTVSVQGTGHVGFYLLQYLAKEGAKLLVADINEDNLKKAVNETGATVVSPNDIYDAQVDIYAPCALGATLNSDTIPRLKCEIVAGSANNQLAVEEIDGTALVNRGIVYAPDFLINAGGLINVYNEVIGNYNYDRVMRHAENIYSQTLTILERAQAEGITPQQAANRIAEERINAIAAIKTRR
jgi:leucine dehydrogenase